MAKGRNNVSRSTYLLILAIVFYIAGASLMRNMDVEPLKRIGIADHKEYTYNDSEGDEHEGETLITIKGLGLVLTYKNIYLATIPMFLLACLFGGFIFKGDPFNNDEVIKQVIFANCILGLLLIVLTTKKDIITTILFWLGILSAYYADKYDRKHS